MYLRSFDFSYEFLLLTFHELLQLLYLLLELTLQFFEALGLLGFDRCSFVFRGGQIRFDTFQLLLVLRENTVNNRHSIGLYCSHRPERSSRKIVSHMIEGALCDYRKRGGERVVANPRKLAYHVSLLIVCMISSIWAK